MTLPLPLSNEKSALNALALAGGNSSQYMRVQPLYATHFELPGCGRLVTYYACLHKSKRLSVCRVGPQDREEAVKFTELHRQLANGNRLKLLYVSNAERGLLLDENMRLVQASAIALAEEERRALGGLSCWHRNPVELAGEALRALVELEANSREADPALHLGSETLNEVALHVLKQPLNAALAHNASASQMLDSLLRGQSRFNVGSSLLLLLAYLLDRAAESFQDGAMEALDHLIELRKAHSDADEVAYAFLKLIPDQELSWLSQTLNHGLLRVPNPGRRVPLRYPLAYLISQHPLINQLPSVRRWLQQDSCVRRPMGTLRKVLGLALPAAAATAPTHSPA